MSGNVLSAQCVKSLRAGSNCDYGNTSDEHGPIAPIVTRIIRHIIIVTTSMYLPTMPDMFTGQ